MSRTPLVKPGPESGRLDCRLSPHLALTRISDKGRGVVATAFIPAGTVLEIAPVIRLTEAESEQVKSTSLDHYLFEWIEKEGGQSYNRAIVAGWVMLVNHAANPNADFDCNYVNQTMDVTAIQDIFPNEEITFDYACKLWFEAK